MSPGRSPPRRWQRRSAPRLQGLSEGTEERFLACPVCFETESAAAARDPQPPPRAPRPAPGCWGPGPPALLAFSESPDWGSDQRGEGAGGGCDAAGPARGAGGRCCGRGGAVGGSGDSWAPRLGAGFLSRGRVWCGRNWGSRAGELLQSAAVDWMDQVQVGGRSRLWGWGFRRARYTRTANPRLSLRTLNHPLHFCRTSPTRALRNETGILE